MSEEKFQDAAALKAWLKGKGVDDDDAVEAANQLFAKGFNKPSRLLNITSEILKSEGVANPKAIQLSNLLKEQQWQQHNPFEGDNAARALQDVLQKSAAASVFSPVFSSSEMPGDQDLDTGGVKTGWRRELGKTFTKRIFIRPHLVEQKRFLNEFMASKQKTSLYVSGPPGCGKTSFFILYFTEYARKNSKRGLLVQYRDHHPCEIIILDGQDIPIAVTKKITGHNLLSALESVAQTYSPDSFDFCVYDGVRQNAEKCSSILSHINVHFGCHKVYITSLEFYIRGGDGSAGSDGPDLFQSVYSWSLSDYQNGLNAGILSQTELLHILATEEEAKESNTSTDNEEAFIEMTEGKQKKFSLLLERKFFYAGGSARLMFDYTLNDLLKEESGVLAKLVKWVDKNMWESFASLHIGTSTETSVSSLLQRIDGKIFPVSKYFLYLGYKHCKEKLIRALRTAADDADNPAMKGWAFELEQLAVVSEGMKNSNFVSSGGGLVIPVAPHNVEYDGTKLTGDTTGDTFVIMCTKWNQGCYDVAFYFERQLLTANFTISASHSLKISYIQHLKSVLEVARKTVNKVTHLGIVQDRVSNFEFQTAEGNGYNNGQPPDMIITLGWSQKLKMHDVVHMGTKDTIQAKLKFNNLGDLRVYSDRSSSRKKPKLEDDVQFSH